MKSEIIPRNLNQPDTFSLGMGLKIKFLDLPVLISGCSLGYYVGNKIMDFRDKTRVVCCELAIYEPKEKLIYYIIIGTFTIVFFALTKIKIENQSILELLQNFVIFSGRQLVYRKENKT